jgi:hypothetical protein
MWTYRDQPFDETPEDFVGFVYLIEEIETGMKYVGKKLFWKPGTKTVKGKKKKIHKESDWRAYFGSSKALQEQVETRGPEAYKRSILRLCTKKGELSYYELKEQVDREVLMRDDYYNAFVGCKIHAKHL